MEDPFSKKRAPFSRPSDKQASLATIQRRLGEAATGYAQYEVAPETMSPANREQTRVIRDHVMSKKDLVLERLRARRESERHVLDPKQIIPATGDTPFDGIEHFAKGASIESKPLAPEGVVLVGPDFRPVGWDDDDDDGLDDLYD